MDKFGEELLVAISKEQWGKVERLFDRPASNARCANCAFFEATPLDSQNSSVVYQNEN